LRIIELGSRECGWLIELVGLEELPAEQLLVGMGTDLDLH
jgi:hypothetical protein